MTATNQLSTSSIQMACRGAAKHGGRCRHFVVNGAGYCHQHEKNAQDAPPPDIILLCVRVSPKRMRDLRNFGVRWATRDEAAIAIRHEQEAIEIGRDPNACPGSGTPVFGKNGINFVEGTWIVPELRTAHFNVVDAHLFRKDGGVMSTLVVNLALNGVQRLRGQRLDIVLEEFDSNFKFCHVWANPPKDGSIVHTINLAHRQQEQGQKLLLYNNGLWGVSENS